MLVAAALVPDTALVVPGVAGRAEVLVEVRRAAVQAVAEVVDAGVETVVVVAPGRVTRELAGVVRPSLGGAGVPDDLLSWPTRAVTLPGEGVAAPGVPAAVALHLLAQAGRTTGVRVVEVAGSARADDLQELGRSLVGAGRTGLVVVGSGSGRHGPDAPLADDPRAVAYDARLLVDLQDAGPEARARLSADDPGVADELAVRGWASWQVLVGAADGSVVRGRLLAVSSELGAQHAVLVWVPVRTAG